MTDEISIKPGLLTEHGWSFAVTFSGRRHSVVCSQVFWKKISQGNISPMEVVRLGLEMARRHNVADTLPDEFMLEEIGTRINNFDKNLRREAHIEAAANPR